MRECPDTDTLVTIGDALSWNLAEGLRHLETCADCTAHFHALALTRAALQDSAIVDDALLARISVALDEEARNERTRARSAQRWAGALETLLAGCAAPIVLISSGIRIESMAAGLLTFVMGAAFLIYGRRLQPTAVRQAEI